jgi:hypothetical protein
LEPPPYKSNAALPLSHAQQAVSLGRNVDARLIITKAEQPAPDELLVL